LKKDNKFGKKSELNSKRAKSGRTGQRETKEVVAELVGRLREKLNPQVASVGPPEERPRGGLNPNLDRLTIGVDLGDRWSNYCILDLEGETLAEGRQLLLDRLSPMIMDLTHKVQARGRSHHLLADKLPEDTLGKYRVPSRAVQVKEGAAGLKIEKIEAAAATAS
jgi:hypothetical protein